MTGYGVPVATTSKIFNILDEQKNKLSVISSEAIYGASSIMFPDNAPVGLNFRLDLPQAQTISANFSVSVTQLNIGVYMYALRYPCGAGGNITDLLQLSTSGAWSSDNN